MPAIDDDSEVIRFLARHRRQVLARDDAAIRELTRRWLSVERALSGELRALAEEAQRLRKAGLPLEGVRQRLARAESLQRQVYRELNQYAGQVSDLVTDNQRQLAALAGQHTAEALDRLGVLSAGFNQLPTAAFETMVGHVSGGAPLFDYFIAQLPEKTVRAIGDELMRGIALGWNPRKTAVAMQNAAALGHRRALLISRTETLRMYRTSSIMNYRESAVVVGWRWVCARQTRTCIACIVKDGTIHEKSEEFVDHPNGRCAAVPYVEGRPWRLAPAREWFKEQKPEVQRGMMGQKMWTMWQGKQIGLDDVAQAHHHPTFGTSYGVATIQQALANAAQRAGGPTP